MQPRSMQERWCRPGDLAATWEGYRQNAKTHPMTDGPLGENIGVTYKTLGPMLYGDQVRAARAKAGVAK